MFSLKVVWNGSSFVHCLIFLGKKVKVQWISWRTLTTVVMFQCNVVFVQFNWSIPSWEKNWTENSIQHVYTSAISFLCLGAFEFFDTPYAGLIYENAAAGVHVMTVQACELGTGGGRGGGGCSQAKVDAYLNRQGPCVIQFTVCLSSFRLVHMYYVI